MLSIAGSIKQDEIARDLIALNDDNLYYGDMGKKYLSKSAAGDLIRNPAKFGIPKEDNINFALGSYFHHRIIEPEKANIDFIDVSSRNSKKYKESVAESGKPYLALKKEVDALDQLISKVMSLDILQPLIYDMGNRYEVPMIKAVKGLMWKGKCDILTDEFVIDLKTTGDISRFRYSAKAFDYDLQAYLYREFFDREFMFVVACKKTHKVEIWKCSDSFYESGERKAQQAVDNWLKYFGPDSWADVNQYVSIDVL